MVPGESPVTGLLFPLHETASAWPHSCLEGAVTDTIKTPWTPEQVKRLNMLQIGGYFHGYTCGNDKCLDDMLLVATTSGWVCPGCAYRQDWAIKAHADEDLEMLSKVVSAGL